MNPPLILGFRAGGAALALPLALVREVRPRPPIVRVPGGHDHLAGVALARGMALPVYDLRRLPDLWAVGPAAGSGPEEHLIVCDWGETSVGLLGTAADLLDPSAMPPADEGATSGGPRLRQAYADGAWRAGAELVTFLNAARLFASLGVPEAGLRDAGEGDGEDDPAGR
ncbi:MAG: chemotaxis protein CheW [Candidatus Polarisedimenticolia bacterium]